MMVAEAFLPSFGVLGVGGFIAFLLGSVFLVDAKGEAGLRISWYAIAPGAVTTGIAFIGLGLILLRSRKGPAQSGREAMIGQTAIALAAFENGRGQVRLGGSIWSARIESEASVARGDQLRIKTVDGLLLTVEPGLR